MKPGMLADGKPTVKRTAFRLIVLPQCLGRQQAHLLKEADKIDWFLQ